MRVIILFFVLKEIIDEVTLYYQRLFGSSAGSILFFMTFLSDAGSDLDL